MIEPSHTRVFWFSQSSLTREKFSEQFGNVEIIGHTWSAETHPKSVL